MSAAARFITGTDTEADRVALRAAMARWLADPETGPSLQQRLGLTRRSLRCELRNQRLRAAAKFLPPMDDWPTAAALAESCRAFEVRRWPRWKRYGIPDTARALDVELFHARQFGPVGLSARQLYNILD